MTINLDTLRKIAEAATPGPWIIDSLESGEHGVFVEESNPDYRKLGCASAIVASHLVGKNAEYLEAFDPETVLALLSRLEQAEQAVQRVRAEIDSAREAGTKIASRECDGSIASIRDYSRADGYLQVVHYVTRALDGHTKQLGGTPTGELADVCSCGKSYWPCTALDGDTRG